MKKVVLITGASRGLGRAISLRFAKGGCAVAVNYFQGKDAGHEVVREIAEVGGEAFPFYADIRSSKDVNSMAEAVYGKFGSVDVLINNAGITTDNLLLRIKREDWENIIATNLTGTFNTIRAVSGYMAKKKMGHIINISSWIGLKGGAGQAAYSASKAGIIGLTRSAALELGRFEIQVNAVLPGFMKTDMVTGLSESAMDRIVSSNILKKGQDVNDVAEFVYSLSLMNNVSGQVFNLDSRVL